MLLGDYAPGNKQVRVAIGASTMLCNLEGPILPRINSFSRIPKAGPSLFSSELPNGNGQYIFSLGNNHIMDYGLPGLVSNLELLYQKGFKSCGAGKDVLDARRPIIVQDNGIKVGIIACCEAQFGVARRNSAGVAEFGPWIYDAIHDLRQTVDAVIVSCHAAVEESPWPSPYIRELYHSFINAGANVVHGHHSHIPQGYESYEDGMIFYGLGNFAVDPDKWRNYSNGMWSLAVEIDFCSKPFFWQPLTLEIRHQAGSESMVIEEGSAMEKECHKRYLEICNLPFDDMDLFEALWQEVALRAYHHHGAEYMGFSSQRQRRRCKTIIDGMKLLKSALLSKKTLLLSSPSQWEYLLWHVMITCESHRQMLTVALGILAGEIEDIRTEKTKQLADEMIPGSREIVYK